MDRLALLKDLLKVNKKLLPIKLHFFLYSLATSGLMSYFPLIAKNIGISATAVGIIYTICPFITVLANPVYGWIADKLQKLKLVLIIIVIIEIPLFSSIVFISPLSNENHFSVELFCSGNGYYSISSPKFVTLKPANVSLKCKSNCAECPQFETNHSFNNKTLCGKNIKLQTEELLNISSNFVKLINISVQEIQLSPECYENSNDSCKTICALEAGSKKSEFATYQFWTLLILMISGLVSENAIIALGDAACYEALEGKVNQFGKQRVWLSIGWGIGNLITGYFLDLINPNKEEKVDFSYCAYSLFVLIFFDIIALSKATLTRRSKSENILKDVGKIFARPHPLFFATATLIIGALSGIQWNYQFWYLEEMGASKFLLGLSTAVLCLGVEGPFLFISGFVVKRVGRDNTMILAFSAFAIWFLSTSFIRNPWWILLINLSQGPTYGLFYAAITSYGKLTTAPGTEATMQTVLGAIFHGLGVGSGSLLGGLGFDLYSGRITYRFTGCFALGAAIVYKLLTTFVAGERSAIYKGNPETTDPVANDTDKKTPKQEIHSIT